MTLLHSYVFLGIQGSGKGTQAQRLSALIGVPHISTGDMLRDQIVQSTPLGVQAKAYLDQGELVPDNTILPMLEERIGQEDCGKGFILDGFPRTLSQARELDVILKRRRQPLTSAVLIDLREEVLYSRLAERWICQNCNAIYNTKSYPPRVAGICDKCGGELHQRTDDQDQAAIKERVTQFHLSTDPVISYYADNQILRRVDGSLTIDEVFQNILDVLGIKS